MASMPAETTGIVGGVDTHQDLHTAAIVTLEGAVLGTESFSTTRAGYRAMLAWFRSHGELLRVGVESTGSYGAGIARHLALSRVPVLGFSSNHHAPADVSGSAPGEGRLRFQPQSSGPSPQPCATCTVELLPSGAHGPQAGPLAPPHGCRSSNPPSRTSHLVLPRPLESFPDFRRDLPRVVGLILEIREDAAGVHAVVTRDRFEGHLAQRRDVLRPARVGPTYREAFLQAADTPADPPQLTVHLTGSHAIGEIPHAQNRRSALPLPAEFDLDPAIGPEDLVPIVGVSDEFDDCIVDISNRQLGVLYDTSRCDFQRSSLYGGHCVRNSSKCGFLGRIL